MPKYRESNIDRSKDGINMGLMRSLPQNCTIFKKDDNKLDDSGKSYNNDLRSGKKYLIMRDSRNFNPLC